MITIVYYIYLNEILLKNRNIGYSYKNLGITLVLKY